MAQFPQRVFSGVQPTGNLHLGNYLGAIHKFVTLQETHDCIFCVVDLHAITVFQDPAVLKANIREVTAAFLACGIDPVRHIVFNQSQVPEHSELAWIFNCVARIGWLSRMTQFKEKAGKGISSQTQGEQVRVTGKKRDDLQAVMALLKGEDLGVPLQFENFRD